MLETCLKRSLWEPPDIDTLYVEYDSDHNPIINKRFTFCEGLDNGLL